jgi:hypothetical protein
VQNMLAALGSHKLSDKTLCDTVITCGGRTITTPTYVYAPAGCYQRHQQVVINTHATPAFAHMAEGG